MARIRGLLFDKDGTLLDFYRTWIPINRDLAHDVAGGDPAVAYALMRAGGHDPETDKIAPNAVLSAAGVAGIAQCFAEALGNRSPDELAVIVARHFREGGAKYSKLIDGVVDHIASFKASGYRLGLATNDTMDGLHASLGQFGDLLDMFEFQAGCDSGHGPKPEPGMANAFAKAIGADPASCAIIGDSIHDLETGRLAGYGLRVGVLTGPSRREDLEPHADIVLDSVLDLAEFLSSRLDDTAPELSDH